ncbi:MAG TPA: hypothetical protein VFU14_16610 [Acidimicrobiales bacterium]|nr:hypothetical protein [Acidimicrobiales bacterium]
MSATDPASPRIAEEPPDNPSTIRLWVLLLAGPVLWIGHFMVVYLFAEAACAARESDDIPFFGTGAIVTIVVASTLVAAGLTALATVAAWRGTRGREADATAMGWAGVLLGALSIVAILAVGLPALAIDPC